MASNWLVKSFFSWSQESNVRLVLFSQESKPKMHLQRVLMVCLEMNTWTDLTLEIHEAGVKVDDICHPLHLPTVAFTLQTSWHEKSYRGSGTKIGGESLKIIFCFFFEMTYICNWFSWHLSLVMDYSSNFILIMNKRILYIFALLNFYLEGCHG